MKHLSAVAWLDWKLGARLLLKYPALTIIGRLSLAAAIAIGVVGIEVAGELLYKRLPFDEGSRVVRLETQDAAASSVEPSVLHDFAIWRRSLKTVAELGAARVSERNVLTGEGRVEALRVAEITASAFPLTRVTPLLGRPLQPTDERQGAEAVAVLAYDVWQRQFLFWVDLTLEPATIAYALLLALVAAPMIGLLPALQATGASVQRGLQGMTSTGGTMTLGGIWSFIIGAQVACTLLFVPAAVGIFTTTLHNQSRAAVFPAERYLTFSLGMDNEAQSGERGVPDDDQIGARRAHAYEELAGRLREEPGVTHVTHGDRLPTMSPEWVAVEMEQDGAPPARLHGNYEGGFAMAAVGAGYHDAFGATIVAGRGLRTADAGAPNGPVVVNEAFMRVVGRNPVGARVRTLQRGGERELGSWHEIVGVVTDVEMLFPADWGAAAYIYRPASAAEVDPVAVAVRVAADAAPLARRVAALARQVDAGLHLRDIATLDEIAQEQTRMVVASVVFGSVLLVALVFSAAGLYALMAVAVARRTREIGIRVALGANPRHVLGSVFARAGRQLGGGIVTGNSLILLLAWRADSLTADLLVSSVVTSVLMAAVGMLACAAPARRALRVQPTEALRQS